MEHHPFHGNLGLEYFIEVPGDGLTLAVLISCQIEFVCIFEGFAKFGHPLLLVGVHLVIGLKPALYINGELRVGAILHGLWERRGRGKVTDMTNRCFHLVVIPQVSANRLGLSR